jgi:carboxyl-terminal processing protease
VLRRRAAVAAAFLVVLLAGLGLGGAAGLYADQAFPDQVPLLAHPAARSDRLDQATLQRALTVVNQDYYGGRNLNYDNLSHGTVRGLVEGLNDRFSYYLDPQEYQRQLSTYNGRYSGIGIDVSFTGDYPVVSTVFPGTPAEAAGIKAGDVILSADGRDLHGLTGDQASNLIRGPEGTKVTLALRRGTQDLSVSVERKSISIPSVRSDRLGASLYIRIYSFGTDTAKDFDGQLTAGLGGSRLVVLDLRDDGGGFIDAAQNVISQFVSSGEAFELRDRQGTVERRQVEGDHPADAVPVVVLVNGNTASASEMVAGSLKVHNRARLVGVTTYGKGSVQQDFPLPDGSDLHLTTKHWFLPDGTSVEPGGIKPDTNVTLASADAMFDVAHPDAGHAQDSQLNAALAMFSISG